ncbi:MAG: ABC transporter ATP-binding protein [Candidatus Binatia bacterium]
MLALRGLDLVIPGGEMCAIVGPSGAGKSTVLHLAGGLTRPDEGTIHVTDHSLTEMDVQSLTLMRRRHVGIVFQFFNLLPYLTAWDNVALPLRLDGVTREEERERVAQALDLVDVGARAQHKPAELSGGEMQRVAVARALVIRPRVILADEPTGNLDSVAGRQIMELLRDLNEETRVTIVVVTHDPVWASICDRAVRIVDGEVVEDLSLQDSGGADPGGTLH